MSENEEPSSSHTEQEVDQTPPAPVAILAPPSHSSPTPSNIPPSSQHEPIDIDPQNTIELRCGNGDASAAQPGQSSGVKQTD